MSSGPSTAPTRSSVRAAAASTEGAGRTAHIGRGDSFGRLRQGLVGDLRLGLVAGLLVGVVLGLLLGMGGSTAWADEAAGPPDPLRTPGPKDQYRRVVASWEARAEAGLAAEMNARGTLTLQLLTPRVSGTYRRAQAQHTLKQYFGGVSDVRLKDVTPKRYPTQRGWAVRFFDYTYRPRGRDPVTTRLKITMKGDGRGNWYLNKIEESPKR